MEQGDEFSGGRARGKRDGTVRVGCAVGAGVARTLNRKMDKLEATRLAAVSRKKARGEFVDEFDGVKNVRPKLRARAPLVL